MKKKTKIISSILGATALGGGIAIGAIAQACGSTPAPAETFVQRIITGVNSLSAYTGTTPNDSIGDTLLDALNQNIDTTVLSMSFTQITGTNISAPVENVYTITINTVTGNLNNGQTFDGNNIVFTITEADPPQISITSAVVSGMTTVETITTDINNLRGNITPTAGTLAADLLTALNANADTGGSIASITFDELITGDFSALGATSVTGIISGITITAATNITGGTGSIQINYTGIGSERVLTFGNFQFINPSFEDAIVTGVTALNSYGGGTLANSIANTILTALNANLGTTVLSLTFANIDITNVPDPVNGVYTITLRDFNGDLNDGRSFEGANNLLFTISNATTPVVSITSALPVGTTTVDTIIADINTLNGSDGSTPQTPLAVELLASLNVNAAIGGSITSVVFANLVVGNFSALENGIVTILMSGITVVGTMTETNRNGDLTIGYTGEGTSRVLSFTSFVFIT